LKLIVASKKKLRERYNMAAQVLPITQRGNTATTLRQLYQDEASDPCKPNYTKIMQRLDASQEDATPNEILFKQLIDRGTGVLQSYLCCGRSLNGSKIFAIHLPSTFKTAFDSDSIWDNKSFGIKGDVVQGMVSIVNFPDDAFEIVEGDVPSLQYMLENLEELQDMPLFPPVLPDDEEYEEIITRKCMFLPAVYAPYLMRSTGYTPQEVWTILHPLIVQRQELEVCRPLLQWLQLASTGTGRTPQLPTNVMTLTVPAADEKLLNHIHSVLHQALPGSAPSSSLESALAQMATALVAQTNENKQAREQKLAEERAEKLPSDRFTVTLPVLMEYLQVDDE
jgi:hypothetical protein